MKKIFQETVVDTVVLTVLIGGYSFLWGIIGGLVAKFIYGLVDKKKG